DDAQHPDRQPYNHPGQGIGYDLPDRHDDGSGVDAHLDPGQGIRSEARRVGKACSAEHAAHQPDDHAVHGPEYNLCGRHDVDASSVTGVNAAPSTIDDKHLCPHGDDAEHADRQPFDHAGQSVGYDLPDRHDDGSGVDAHLDPGQGI